MTKVVTVVRLFVSKPDGVEAWWPARITFVNGVEIGFERAGPYATKEDAESLWGPQTDFHGRKEPSVAPRAS